MECIKIPLVRVINSGVLFATDTTDVTDKLLVTNKIWLFKIVYPLHPFEFASLAGRKPTPPTGLTVHHPLPIFAYRSICYVTIKNDH
jgi:hypothetical protein